jgi:hypothetical protein
MGKTHISGEREGNKRRRKKKERKSTPSIMAGTKQSPCK